MQRKRHQVSTVPDFSYPTQLSCRLMAEQAARVARDCYDIGELQDIVQLYGGYTNLSFKVITRTAGGFQKYFLRIYRQGTPIEHICFEHSLVEHIVDRGGHMVAALIRTRDGANFVRRPIPNPDSSGELLYAMFAFIGGEDKYSWTCNHLSREEYIYSGRMLAELHRCAAGFDPGGLTSMHRPISERLVTLPVEFAHCAEQTRQSCFDRYFLKNLEDMAAVAEKIHNRLVAASNLPIMGIHGDFHPGNQKYNLNRVIGVFDFDRACYDFRLFDVALAVIYFCCCWEKKMDGNLWLRKADLFLRAYQKRAAQWPAPGPLNREEIETFSPLLTAAALSLIRWATVEAYYLERENCPDQEYLFYLKHNVRLVRWLEHNRGRVENMLRKALA
ncbi:MAG: phosphotransferase [Syntrophotalea sp.]|uniref:phosphotransferase n=1 Tax=Syntrophotalea sp. TaxID=2812029 RepID=UPI003D151B07